ncbi:maternal protein tudor [Anopheles aquasalis]|uniref:maternal protein tudor n=1 Tax=Anopheles aquasalis TaxID=42839 RepID=UPI00215B1F49|nr:maternal protein tudor [Anopheles aquasalis]XP_050089452.1 maternal protein tudor [Anopheles aquasalis]
MNVNRYQAAKNLQPARSLRTPNLHPNRNALGDYGYAPHLAEPYRPQQPTSRAGSTYANGNLAGSTHPVRSSSQSRKHDVLRTPVTGNGFSDGPGLLPGRSTPTLVATGSLTFNASTLSVGAHYEVTVSYIQNGPKQFMVQQRSADVTLKQMMSALARVPLRTITRKLQLGMPCLGRYTPNLTIYRALITAIGRDGSCTVSYVDYGHSETVHPANLYEIPPEFLRYEIFSTRFALAGVRKLEDINADVAGLFSRLVAGKPLTLRVMPPDGAAFVSYCELYENGENVFNRLLAMCQLNLYRFPGPGSLVRGASYPVVIRYIESCAQFYVHMLDNVHAFDKMMDDLATYCRNNGQGNGGSSLIPTAVNIGDAVIVELGTDDVYRAIVEETSPVLKVRLVDYGNSLKVERGMLRRLSPAFTHQRPEAYECCLEGFERSIEESPPHEETINLSTKQLEMLSETADSERKPFKLIVCDIREGLTIVNLFDESQTPVANMSKTLLKLKNPIKFNKELQSNHQKYSKQQQQPVSVSNSLNTKLSNSGESAKVFSSSGVSSSAIASDYIDLTDEEWIGPGSGNQSSGYEQLVPPPQQPTTAASNELLQKKNTVNSRNSHESSSTANTAKQQPSDAAKRMSAGEYTPSAQTVAPNDIPRFSQERIQTPHYYEHDDRGVQEPDSVIQTKPKAKEKFQSEDSLGSLHDPAQTHASAEFVTKNQQQNIAPTEIIESYKAASGDYLPFNSMLPEQIVPLNTKLEVVLSWWYSPEQFYVRLRIDEERYQDLMKQLQKHYRNKSNQQHHQKLMQNQQPDPRTSKLPTGSLVVVRHPKHNAYYRARLLKYNESNQRYKVEVVDGGNKLIVSPNDLWMLERRFGRLAPLAISCALPEVRLQCEVKELQNRIDNYLSNDQLIEAVFIELRDGKYHCKIQSQGNDLKMQLISDGLLSQVFVDVDLYRLKGQTLKVQLVELKSLANFRVKLFGHDAIFNCRQDGCDVQADVSNIVAELQSKYIDKYCTAQVVDVTNEEKLVLSLLVPSLTCQALPNITQMPILLSKFNVYVTHVESPNCLHVQNVLWNDRVTKLIDDLYEYYECQQPSVPLAELVMGEVCASRSQHDGNWYRVKIVSLQDIEHIEVLLVDYGSIMHVKHSDLKRLAPCFIHYSAFAHRVYLPMATISGMDEERIKLEITQLTEGFELTLKVLEFRNDIWIVDITSNDDYSIVNVLKDKQLVADLEHESIFNQRQIATPVPGAVVRPSVEDHEGNTQRNRARICHVDNPCQLFIQLESDMRDLNQLQETLQIISSSLPPLRDFSADRYCIAQYSVDDLWYRALIIDSHDDLIIQFVDYGHTDVVTSNKKSSLRDINDDLMRWKVYAKQCALLVQPMSLESMAETGRKKNASWKEVATTILRSLEEVEVQFLAEAQGVHYISVRSGEKDIAEMLVEKKLAVRMYYVPSGQLCFTSHIDSISEFYLQLERDIYPLDTMSNYLSDVSKFPDVDQPQVGMICIAEYEDDELWYRAKLLAIPRPGEYEVFFLDYGNTSTVRKLKALDTSIAELARLCTKCCLRLPENVRKWSTEAEAKFLELTAMGQTVVTVQLYSPGPNSATVELFLEGRNIVEQLVTLCEKGNLNVTGSDSMNSSFYLLCEENRLDDSYQLDDQALISHVISPAEFYIQITNCFDALRNMEELLAAKAAQCEVVTGEEIHNGLFCLAQLATSGKYYRGLVLSEVSGGHSKYHQVLLVDYGNRATATELRRMPEGIEEISRLAKKCCLEHYLSTDEEALGAKRWASIRSRFIELTDSGKEVFSFQIVRNDCDPMIVRLFNSSGVNVEDLIKGENIEMDSVVNVSSEDTSLKRHKPKQAFFRTNSDFDFLEH